MLPLPRVYPKYRNPIRRALVSFSMSSRHAERSLNNISHLSSRQMYIIRHVRKSRSRLGSRGFEDGDARVEASFVTRKKLVNGDALFLRTQILRHRCSASYISS